MFNIAVYCQPSAYCVTPHEQRMLSLFTERKKYAAVNYTTLMYLTGGSQNLPLANIITFYGILWLHFSHTQGDLICVKIAVSAAWIQVRG